MPFTEFAAQRRFGDADYRRWVIAGAILAAGGYAISTLAGLVLFGDASLQQEVTTVVCWVALWLAWRGDSSIAAVLVLASVWMEVHYSMLVSEEFPPIGMLTTPVFVASAGLLLGRWPSLVLAAFTVAVTGPIVFHSPGGAAMAPGRLTYWLILHGLVTFATWAIIAQGLAALERGLESMRRKETELAEIIRHAPDGILVVDADGRVLTANPAARAILGLGESESVDRSLFELLSADGVTDLPEAIRQSDSLEAPIALSFMRADGDRSYAEVTWRRTEGDRRLLSLRDVTERVRAEADRREIEEQLAHARRIEAIGQLAGGIAHDFNNLLTAVAGSADLLRPALHDEDQIGLLDEIVSAQERGAVLTKQLLSFARRDFVQPRVFDLSAQVMTLQRLLQRVSGEQVQIVCDVEPDCRVRADIGQIEQALVNLVTNARDAMPHGGTCTIRCQAHRVRTGEQRIVVRVSDTGVGMDEETLAHAFEPFFTTKPRGRGTGLGLASVHGIVMQSGGAARIESVPGRGTTVTLEFPVATDPVERAGVPDAVPSMGESSATILVAEDDDGTRGVVDRILRRAGYRVLLAPDGVAAARLAEKHAAELDLLLSDVMMPGLTGPQLAADVLARRPDLPVVFMSGYPEDALTRVSGFVMERDFLAKPFSSAVLLARVQVALARRDRVSS
jgi:PAS domain S-box-containing protein